MNLFLKDCHSILLYELLLNVAKKSQALSRFNKIQN